MQPLTAHEEQQFNEWREENNYSYYSGGDQFIHLPTRELFSFETVYKKFQNRFNGERQMFQHLAEAVAKSFVEYKLQSA